MSLPCLNLRWRRTKVNYIVMFSFLPRPSIEVNEVKGSSFFSYLFLFLVPNKEKSS